MLSHGDGYPRCAEAFALRRRYESFHMQKRMSRHKRSTVMPCTGRDGSDADADAGAGVTEPLGNSCDTAQLTSRHALAVTFATFERVLSAYLYADPASNMSVTLSPGCNNTIASVFRP